MKVHNQLHNANLLIAFACILWACKALSFPGQIDRVRSSSNNSGRRPPNSCDNALKPTISEVSTRRSLLLETSTLALSPLIINPLSAVAAPSTTSNRVVEGFGGGFDIQGSQLPIGTTDVLFPPSLEGVWLCQRKVTLAEGDLFQAQQVWNAFSGTITADLRKQPYESYLVQFTPTSDGTYTCLDRGMEVESRSQKQARDVHWDAARNTLAYSSGPLQAVEWTVVDRKADLPSDEGFGGSNELFRISTGNGLSATTRAARVQRRFRRAYDDKGNRVVEGLEIVKTYRVLDGIAGVEMPTATVKSQLRLVRPQST